MTLIATCMCVLANSAWGYYTTHAIVYPHVHVHTFAHIHVHVLSSALNGLFSHPTLAMHTPIMCSTLSGLEWIRHITTSSNQRNPLSWATSSPTDNTRWSPTPRQPQRDLCCRVWYSKRQQTRRDARQEPTADCSPHCQPNWTQVGSVGPHWPTISSPWR